MAFHFCLGDWKGEEPLMSVCVCEECVGIEGMEREGCLLPQYQWDKAPQHHTLLYTLQSARAHHCQKRGGTKIEALVVL